MTAKEKDLVLGDQRLQLEFSHFAEAGNASFSAKLDFVRDAIDSTMAIDIREAYLDLSLYGYRGFGPSPAIKQIQTLGGARLQLFFPKLRVYGASAQGGFLGGIVSLEGGYYDSVEDRGGTDPFVDNPEIRFLMGYQRAFGADLTVGSQYYAEAMRKFNEYEVSLPTDFPKANRIRHNITLRVTQLLSYQTVRFSLFAWVSPNDEDYYINPEVRYNFTDELWGAVGGNIFGGSETHTFLGQFEENDNVYLTVRYGF